MAKVRNPFIEESEARRYDRYRPRYHELPFQELCSFFNKKFERALDVACGTGHSTRALATISKSVVGCDISSSMLAEARLNSEIKFLEAQAEALPFGDGSFEYVNISMEFQWLDQSRFLKEARRVLIPGGYLGVDNYGFTGVMVGHEKFRGHYVKFDREQSRRVPRNSDYPGLDMVTEHGLRLVREFPYDHKVPMTLEKFGNYLMTVSRFLALTREDRIDVKKLIDQEFEPYFGGREQELVFSGVLKLYQATADTPLPKEFGKAYYHAHDQAYKNIRATGGIGWGNAKTQNELSDPETVAFLKSVIEKYFPDTKGFKALDLGAGSGPTTFIMASRGFDVTAVEISETAIELGRELAHQQDLKVKFVHGDVLRLEDLQEKFDFIYDSHCLHCIVFNQDRIRTLTGVRQILNPSGIFVIDTMVWTEGVDLTKNFETLRLDENYILWHQTDFRDLRGIVELDGKLWCPQRRIYPKEKIFEEVAACGLKVLSQTLDRQSGGHPDMLRMVVS
jgi:ubiquinone/menaquinone biosynthesis C-methylase UbiE